MRTLLCLAILALATNVDAADKDKYQSKEGRFAVQFPPGVKVKKTVQQAGNAIEMKLALVEKKDQAFVTMYMDLPAAAQKVPAKQILDGAEKGSVARSGGKHVKSKDIAFGAKKLPGREILVDRQGNKIRTWVIIDGVRIYVVAVGGPKDFATSKDGDAFLKSFEITK